MVKLSKNEVCYYLSSHDQLVQANRRKKGPQFASDCLNGKKFLTAAAFVKEAQCNHGIKATPTPILATC